MNYSLYKGMQKACAAGAKLIVSFSVSHGIVLAGKINGIEINLGSELVMAGLLNSIAVTTANWLKVKYGCKWL